MLRLAAYLSLVLCMVGVALVRAGPNAVPPPSYLFANYTPVDLPINATFFGNFADVYVQKRTNHFFILTSESLYQLDYDRTAIINENNITAIPAVIQTDEIAGHNYIFLTGLLYQSDALDDPDDPRRGAYVPPITASIPSALYRFDAHNITAPPTILSFIEFPDYSISLIIDPKRHLGFVISQDHANIVVVDLATMTNLTSFNYITLAAPPLAFAQDRPGGHGMAYDKQEEILYVGVNCHMPTAGYIWQYDVSNIFNPKMTDKTIFAADPCFNANGFVAEGHPWFVDQESGWIGSFSRNKLHWQKERTVASRSLVLSTEYDAENYQAYFIETGVLTGHFPTPGRVIRTCLREDAPHNVHEAVAWSPDPTDLLGSYLELRTRTLYTVTCANIYAMTVNGTDCAQ